MSLAVPSRWQRITGRALDFLLPPLCLCCEAPTSAHRTLCPACWSRIHFIAKPFCMTCGAPFEVPMGEDALCAGCIAEPPEFTAARAPMLYDDFSRCLVLSFKHADRIHPAPALAGWLHRAGAEFWKRTDFIARYRYIAGACLNVSTIRWRFWHMNSAASRRNPC